MKKRNAGGTCLLLVLFAVCALAVVPWWFSQNFHPSAAQVATVNAQPLPSVTAFRRIGDLGEVRSAAGGDIFMGATEADLDAANSAGAGKDTVGLQQLAGSGRLWTVPSGTPAQLIGVSGILAQRKQVRLLSGAHSNQAGWVEPEFFQ